MSQITAAAFALPDQKEGANIRVVRLLSRIIFVSMLVLVAWTAIPYGTAEIWWKAIFAALIFVLTGFALLENMLSKAWRPRSSALLLAPLALAAYALLQSLSLGLGQQTIAGIPVGSAISADPFQSRLFALQLLALTLAAALLYRYAATRRRLTLLINVILAVAVVSAIFGILRQTTQQEIGFGLPLLKPDQGYGQFINKNHFAFMMEMALGLSLGMALGGGVKRDRAIIYFTSVLPIWTALVLSNSRGALIALFAQVVAAVLLLTNLKTSRASQSRVLHQIKRLPVRVALLVVLLGVVFAGTIWLGGDRLVGNLETVSGEFDPATAETRQGASRNEIWRSTWLMFRNHPVAGVGLGGYATAIPTYHDASGTLTPQEAHNEYLELISSGGLIGGAIGVWFAILLVRQTRISLRASNRFRRTAALGATLGIVGVAVHSMVDFGLHMIANALIFAALVVIATARTEHDN